MVTEIRRESHSAKASGQRPEFNRLIDDIRLQRFDGILAWAPDRLSRNAGDLGTIVDLMDQGVIREIRTNGSRFTNSPSDKFMLMMLCSQAKLENDNKSINIKRGLKAKVEMGYRPNMAPMGYLHDKNADKGTKRFTSIPNARRASVRCLKKSDIDSGQGDRLNDGLITMQCSGHERVERLR